MTVEITSGWDGDAVVDLGEADNWNGAAELVNAWAQTIMAYVPPNWTVTRIVDPPHYVVDFGSHFYFARYKGEPK